ncbi:MurR/RpiR family transcriptional regulator [Pseudokordiimonas caeni]
MRQASADMSANERKLADFIQKNASLLRDYSSQQLAEAVGVSQSSVVKFSQKLGFKGYPALKLAVSEDLARAMPQQGEAPAKAPQHAPSESSGEHLTPFEELAKVKADVLRWIADLNSEESLMNVVRALERANRIQFVAAGSSALIVKDFALKLLIMGKSVVAESDLFMQRANAATLRGGDVLFAISVSGNNTAITEMVEKARENGVTIISLTHYDVNPLSLLAHHTLFTFMEKTPLTVPHVVARVALQHVIDALYLVMSSRDTQGRELLELSQQVSEHF